jgi:uncharacterized membrane protein
MLARFGLRLLLPFLREKYVKRLVVIDHLRSTQQRIQHIQRRSRICPALKHNYNVSSRILLRIGVLSAIVSIIIVDVVLAKPRSDRSARGTFMHASLQQLGVARITHHMTTWKGKDIVFFREFA